MTEVLADVFGMFDTDTDELSGLRKQSTAAPLVELLKTAHVRGARALLQSPRLFVQPWQLGVMGDSRANFLAGAWVDPGIVGPSGSLFDASKAPTWAAAYMGDAEYTACHAVSGDTVITGAAGTGWYNPARTNGKTMADLASRGLDGVQLQSAVNDVNNAATTNTAQADAVVNAVVASYKQHMQTLAALNLPFVFETSYPCQAAGWAANPDLKQYALNQINAQLSAYVETYFTPSLRGVVADSASELKQADGYANAALYLGPANIHLAQAGARIAGAKVAAAWRRILPKKAGAVGVASSALPFNLIPRGLAATAINPSDAGVGVATPGVWGVDPVTGEAFLELTWTPGTLAAGIARCKVMVQASVGAASSLFTLAGTETLAGSARVILDDGAGGAPNANSLDVRHRLYAAGSAPAPFFGDWGGIGNLGVPDFASAQDLRCWTPRCVNTSPSTANAISQVTAPAGDSTGYGLYLLVEASRVGAPCRIRLYPTLRKVL